MDMKKEFEEAVRVIAQIDWSSTSRRAIEILETTTRYLGGLLSAYDLSREASLLAKAQELGDMLYMAFDTPSRMPSVWLDLEKAKNGQLVAEKNQPAASATGLFLEFTRLSQVAQNAKYYDAVARIVNVLHDWQNLTKVVGMWPSYFDLQDTTFNHDNVFSLGVSSGVTYENIVKMYALLGGTDSRYEEMYRSASEAIVRTLLFRPMTPRKLDVVFPGTFRVANKEPLDPEIQHLACFAGGMFALVGKIFNVTEHVNLGARLTNGCMWTHKAFPHGVMPEAFTMVPCELDGCKWDETRWRKSIEDNTYEGREDLPMGFVSARDPSYTLRPEAIESMFILYRITGHQEYRDNAWKIFQEIQKATETDDGNRVAADVTTKGKLQQREFSEASFSFSITGVVTNILQSYWLSGTLKYLYLMFSAPEVISLDDYVLSTGGHPFRIPKR
ncbi:hypothetical protein LTS08_007011 [Lithohypha guttulata]|uniref:uncharacterized protein n=1 Tax=Lithohypha guttulata TaxID=1690604 RepID=UPI002DE1869E|nr:hypothetical protein LTR51_002061 [Lithohypha guttulata]KAK5097596.1 hypothetical protein LTS08_007011 [Lithohypha guttulata]